mgnify:FL=1
MVMKVLFLTFMSMCMGIGICMGMGTEPPSEPFQGTFEQSKHSIAPVRLILHGRGTFEYYSEYGGLSYKGIWQRVGDDAIRVVPLETAPIDLLTSKPEHLTDTVRIINNDVLRVTFWYTLSPLVCDYHRVEE